MSIFRNWNKIEKKYNTHRSFQLPVPQQSNVTRTFAAFAWMLFQPKIHFVYLFIKREARAF